MRDTEREDRYGNLLGSEAYRRSRRGKARVIAHLCASELRAARRIADLGAGTGLIKRELEKVAGRRILGFDIDPAFFVERRGMVLADVRRLPLRGGDFDLLIVNHLYEHVPDPGALFREVARVLAPGGRAYVTAGSRLAIVEPHFRLPFLSWLPTGLADRYVRATGRGGSYEGIRFLSYRPLTRLIRASGLSIHDITERALDELIDSTWGSAWARIWAVCRRAPAGLRRRALEVLSPQWFFLLEKPAGEPARPPEAK
ncbi:MAG: methyltransferase domain-containing protein [Gemmatimonadota bacterium]